MRSARCRCAAGRRCLIRSCASRPTPRCSCLRTTEAVPDTRQPVLIDLLRHDAFHYPGKAAIRLDGVALSFAELARRIDDTAQALGGHVGPGDRVGLWLGNSFAWIASFL